MLLVSAAYVLIIAYHLVPVNCYLVLEIKKALNISAKGFYGIY